MAGFFITEKLEMERLIIVLTTFNNFSNNIRI